MILPSLADKTTPPEQKAPLDPGWGAAASRCLLLTSILAWIPDLSLYNRMASGTARSTS